MTIKVTATCNWCQNCVETDVKKPVPEGWVQESIRSPNWAESPEMVDGNFCKEECKVEYLKVQDQAHSAAAKDYYQKVLSEMNNFRAKWLKGRGEPIV